MTLEVAGSTPAASATAGGLMMKVHITLNGNSFEAEGDDLQAAELEPLFRTWITAQPPNYGDQEKIDNFVEQLKISRQNLAAAVDSIMNNGPTE